MQAVILAAGLGDRLGDLTNDTPKAMVKVDGRELIARVMDFTDHPSIDEKVVVTGYKSEKLENFLRTNYPETKIMHNPKYRKGNILTLKAALPALHDGFILMNVDHIYPKRMMPHILSKATGISAICDFDRTLVSDDMKVKLQDGKLSHINKTLDDFDCGYIGMTFCEKQTLGKYLESFNAHLDDAGDSSCVENVLGWMAEKDIEINICDASGMPWLEVDTPDDLALAEEALRRNLDFLL